MGVTILAMVRPPRIGPKKPIRHYMAEWREYRHLTQQQLGDRLGVEKGTISRWENDVRGVNLDILGAVCEALDIHPERIYRPPPSPDSKSPEDMLAGAPEPVRREVADFIEYLMRKRSR